MFLELDKTHKWDDIGKNLSEAIFIIEKELHFFVDEDYPVIKFHNQLMELEKHYKRQKKEMNKAKRKKR